MHDQGDAMKCFYCQSPHGPDDRCVNPTPPDAWSRTWLPTWLASKH